MDTAGKYHAAHYCAKLTAWVELNAANLGGYCIRLQASVLRIQSAVWHVVIKMSVPYYCYLFGDCHSRIGGGGRFEINSVSRRGGGESGTYAGKVSVYTRCIVYPPQCTVGGACNNQRKREKE